MTIQTTALAAAVTANASQTAVALVPKENGDTIAFYAYGTWDTSTLVVEVSHDNTNWFTVATFTASGVSVVNVIAAYVRTTVSSVGGSTSVSCDMCEAATTIVRADS